MPFVKYQGTSNFKFLKKIGEGSVGEVHLVRHKVSKELFALKKIMKVRATLRD